MNFNKSVIFPSKREALNGLSVEHFCDLVRSQFKDRAQHIFLFGSYAKGCANDNSDVDLIIVTDTKLPFERRHEEFDLLWKISPNIDFLIYTPSEFDELYHSENSPFWEEFRKSHIQIL